MKIEIKNAILEMLSDDAIITDLGDTVKQMNEIMMREYNKLFAN